MGDSFERLCKVQPGVATAAIFTGAASQQTIVKHIRVSNPSLSTPATLTLYDSGATDADTMLPPVTLQPGEWAEWDGTMCVAAGDTIRAKASVAATLTVIMYGDKVT